MGNRPIVYFLLFFISLFICIQRTHAASVNTNVTFEGSLTDSNANPVNLSGQTINFSIVGSTSSCIYYSENTTTSGNSDGSIIHKIGTGNRVLGPAYDSSVFTTSVSAYNQNSSVCTPTATGEKRLLKVIASVNGVVLNPLLIELTSVPSALNSDLFAGQSVSSFLSLSNSSLSTTSQTAFRDLLGLGGLATKSRIDLSSSDITGTVSSAYLPTATSTTAGVLKLNSEFLDSATGSFNLSQNSILNRLAVSSTANINSNIPFWFRVDDGATGTTSKLVTTSLVGIGGLGAVSTDYALSISGTTLPFRKIAIGGDQVIYKPDQNSFLGSFFVGDGGTNLSSSSSGGRYNTGIGLGSLYTVTSGRFNTSLGMNSLSYLISGSNNTSIGALSLSLLTTTNNNTAIGYKSMTSSSTGANNTAIGSQSGFVLSGDNNTVIGSDSGYSLVTGSDNTFIGKGSGSGITSGSQNTIIGSYTGSDIQTVSNYVIISDGGNNRRITIDNLGNTGIGTLVPKATLDVNGFMKLKKYDSSSKPTCSTELDGAIILTTTYKLCACNGTNWINTDSGGGSCVF